MLQSAAACNATAVVECIDEKTGEHVALLCLLLRTAKGEEARPIAVMMDKDEPERYTLIGSEGGGG